MRVLPNPASVRSARARVREKLYTSLHHIIFDYLGQTLPPPISKRDLRLMVPEGDCYPSAAVFAMHSALLDAARQDDRPQASLLFEMLRGMTQRDMTAPEGFGLFPLNDAHLHSDDIVLLKRVFADDIGLTTKLTPPPQETVNQATQVITEALACLDTCAPEWGEELRLLANQAYLAVAKDDEAYLFGGAAVFDAFGGILLNPMGLQSRATTLLALVHESSHQQMFLFHLDDPVLLNDADASYSSPLRKEPRPMEGIFHAMWVSARMVLAADAIIASPDAPQWVDELTQEKARARRAAEDCIATVAEHAKLTELGQDLFSATRKALDVR